MSVLERQAWQAWASWGLWAKWTTCNACGEFLYCRADRFHRFVCLECWDQGHRR